MNGCQTCGGFGNRHDPVAHDFVEWAQRDCEQRGNVYEAHEWTIGLDGDECAFCYVLWEDADEDCKRCSCTELQRMTVCHDIRNEPHLVGCPRWGTPKERDR